AHQANGFRGWPDESDAGCRAEFREFGVFGQEPVPRMDPVHAGAFGQVHDGLHVEKTLHRVGADEVRLVGLLDVDGGGVALRVDYDGPDPELPAGADDAHGDLAAVGDEDSLKHSPSESATGYHSALGQVERL